MNRRDVLQRKGSTMNWKAIAVWLIAHGVATSASAMGILFFSEARNPNGLWALSTSTGAPTHVGATSVRGAHAGLSPSGEPGLLFGGGNTDDESNELRRIRMDGSGSIRIGIRNVTELAYDPEARCAVRVWSFRVFRRYLVFFFDRSLIGQ
jgi:hypothetical protein